MSVLKIKNSNNQWITIPAIKGEKGDPGNTGQSGAYTTVNVTGTTPTVVAEDNTRYICGEVTSLSFTPCVSGICDIQFTSGLTATTLTLPNTVKTPDWFDASTLETNTVYEINVLDGIYGVVAKWAL